MDVLHQPTVIAVEEITVGIFLNGMVEHMDHDYGFWFVLGTIFLLSLIFAYITIKFSYILT